MPERWREADGTGYMSGSSAMAIQDLLTGGMQDRVPL